MRRRLALIGIVVAAACASIPKASPELDAQAKRFDAPPSGKVLIYVFRPSQFIGSAVALPVLVNGTAVGANGPGTYIVVSVAPGPVTVATQTGEAFERVAIQAVADSTYFVYQQARMGLGGARATLKLVDSSAGREGVLSTRRADTVTPPQ